MTSETQTQGTLSICLLIIHTPPLLWPTALLKPSAWSLAASEDGKHVCFDRRHRFIREMMLPNRSSPIICSYRSFTSAGISVQNVTEFKLMSADVAPSTRSLISQKHKDKSFCRSWPWPIIRSEEERLQDSGVELNLYFNGFLLWDQTATDGYPKDWKAAAGFFSTAF